MISIREIIHRLELLIDDSNACLMSSNYDLFDVLGTLAFCLECCMNSFGRFNCRLRMELR